jgi:hypothetical protein
MQNESKPVPGEELLIVELDDRHEFGSMVIVDDIVNDICMNTNDCSRSINGECVNTGGCFA